MDKLDRLVLARMWDGRSPLQVVVVECRVEDGEVVDRCIEDVMEMRGERSGERGVDDIEGLKHKT